MKLLRLLLLSLAVFFATLVYQQSRAGDTCSDVNTTEQVEKQKVINTDVPKHLKDAVIIVRQADGRESVVSANQFKVVPRKQQYLVTETSKHTERICMVAGKDKKNLVMGGLRRDWTGLHKSISGNVGSVSSEKGAVADIGYMRQGIIKTGLGDLGAGASVDTSGVLRGMIGIEF